MSRKKKVIIIILSALFVLLVLYLAYEMHQVNKIMSAGTEPSVNRDDYILTSFEIRESSGNALSTDPGHSQSITLSFETIYIDTAETDGQKKIELDETMRKNLETDLVTLIEEHSLWDWNGFDEHLQVMDESNGFSFRAVYKNEDEIVASGGFAFPENYGEVFNAIEAVFLKYCD